MDQSVISTFRRVKLCVCLLLALLFTPSQHLLPGEWGNFLQHLSLPRLESGAEILFLVCIAASSLEPAPRGSLVHSC